eukprot:3844702-Amphidinium_carterae.1
MADDVVQLRAEEAAEHQVPTTWKQQSIKWTSSGSQYTEIEVRAPVPVDETSFGVTEKGSGQAGEEVPFLQAFG